MGIGTSLPRRGAVRQARTCQPAQAGPGALHQGKRANEQAGGGRARDRPRRAGSRGKRPLDRQRVGLLTELGSAMGAQGVGSREADGGAPPDTRNQLASASRWVGPQAQRAASPTYANPGSAQRQECVIIRRCVRGRVRSMPRGGEGLWCCMQSSLHLQSLDQCRGFVLSRLAGHVQIFSCAMFALTARCPDLRCFHKTSSLPPHSRESLSGWQTARPEVSTAYLEAASNPHAQEAGAVRTIS